MDKKNYIPGTDPKWGYEMPDGYTNSMIAKDGRAIDTGWNFDEKDNEYLGPDDDYPEFDPEAAEKARAEIEQKIANSAQNPDIIPDKISGEPA